MDHTNCVTVKDKLYPGFPWFTGWVNNPLSVVIVAAIATLFAGGGGLPAKTIPALLIVIGYCRWWLYDRLICLDGDKCVIGLLGRVEPPEGKSFPDSFDTDYSINLVLAPHQYQELPPDYLTTPQPPVPLGTSPKDWHDQKFKEALHRQIADDGIQGELIKETNTTGDVRTIINSKRYGFEGYFSTMGGSTVNYAFQPYLHCEFEGNGIFDLMTWAEAALVFATAAAIVCSIPGLGWIACAILSAIAWIISIVGIFVALNDKASPSVYDPVTGQTSSAVHPGKDILFVKGAWIFDTAHEGWNEIHPIKKCQLVATAVYSSQDIVDWDRAIAPYMVGRNLWGWALDPDHPDVNEPLNLKIDQRGQPAEWKKWVQSWCDHVGTITTPSTVDAQSRPENQWTIHPAIDGCQPEGRDAVIR